MDEFIDTGEEPTPESEEPTPEPDVTPKVWGSFRKPKPKPEPKQAKIGVVIGSLGVRAFAALPLLLMLNSKNIKVDSILGCSGGGLLACLYSAGYDLKQIARFFASFFTRNEYMRVDTKTLMNIAKQRGSFSMTSGLYRATGLQRAYKVIFKDMRMEDLNPKTVLYATDITTGEGTAIREGRIADAVQACAALYPLMPPVKLGGKYLADGSYTSPLPVLEMLKENVDVIIAFLFDDKLNPKPRNFLECYLNMSTVAVNSLQRAQMFASVDMHHHEIVFIHVPFPKFVPIWEVSLIPEILNAGKMAAVDHLPQLLESIKSFERT